MMTTKTGLLPRVERLEGALRAMLAAFDGAIGGIEIGRSLFEQRCDAVREAFAVLADSEVE